MPCRAVKECGQRELPEITGPQHLPGRNEIPGDADQQIRHVGTAGEHAGHVSDDRRHRDGRADGAFDDLLSPKLVPPASLLRGQRGIRGA